MISSMNRKLSLRLPGDVFGFVRSILIGVIGGTVFLPVFFLIWLGMSFERDFINSCDEYGQKNRDLDQMLVILLFVVWVFGILIGYFYWDVRGAIIANFINGAVCGAVLGCWLHLQQTDTK